MTSRDEQEKLEKQHAILVAAEQIEPSSNNDLTRSTGENSRAGKLKKPGELIAGRYEIISVLGEGGMGVVYKARQSLLNKVYAIKLLNTERTDETAVKRFHAEAKAACELAHPNLITVFVLDVDDGHPFMVMDFVDGISLSELIRRTKLVPFQDLIKIGLQVCEGMSYAHARGILHRDLKPSNIMLTGADGSWQARVVDFGIAKMVDTKSSSDHALTRTGEIFGSPLYMSPEQAIGNAVDARSDIYSLGCLLFEALTGKPPFVGDNPLETMYMRTRSTAPLISEAAPDQSFPQQLQDALRIALATDPTERFQTMAQFKDALSAALTDDKTAIAPQKRTQPKSYSLHILSAILIFAVGVWGWFAFSNFSTISTHKTKPASNETANNASSDFDHKLISLGLNRQSTEADLSRGKCNIDVTDDDVSALTELPLSVLKLNKQSKITDKSLAAIARMHGLRELSLKDTQITSQAVLQLQELPNLRKIDLSDCKNLDDRIGEPLGKMKSLTCVDLFFSPIGDGCLKQIADLPVTHMFLRGTKITNAGLRYISKMPMTNFSMGDTKNINDESLAIVASQFPHLQYLNLQGCPSVTDKGIKHLTSLKQLSDLRLPREYGITDAAFKSLAKIASLDQIFLDETPVGDLGIRELSGHPRIHFLNLPGTRVSDGCVGYLLKMPSLRTVNLRDTKVSEEGRKRLNEHHIKAH